MNKYLYELPKGDLIDLRKIIHITRIKNFTDDGRYTFQISDGGVWSDYHFYNSKEEAKKARDKLIEAWSRILDDELIKNGIYEMRGK